MQLSSPALQAFAEQSTTLFASGQKLAAALPANTVQVWPGGATFTTIQAAINSIKDASPQVQYQVAVGPGTYNENVTMIDNIYIIGTGQTTTFITAPPQPSAATGVINSSSNSGISEVTINATGGAWGVWPIGVKICGSGNFHMSGVTINATDGGNGGNNVRGITNNTGSYAASLILGQSILTASGAESTTATGIELFGMSGVKLYVDVSAISVTSASSSFGLSTAVGTTAVLDDSKISAGTWALYNSDGSAPITANQCTISGPVSSGVVVNN
jgi:hypothetical protein